MNAAAGVALLGAAGLIGGGLDLGNSGDDWQADIRIQSIEVVAVRGQSLNARVVVTSDNGEDARAARLEILLPAGVGVVRLAPGCRAGTGLTPGGQSGRISCELGDIPVRGVREVTVVTTAPGSGAPIRVAVFVVSDTPDPLPANNYAERVVP